MSDIIDETVFGDAFVNGLREADSRSARAEQSAAGVIGPSDLVCRERVRRMLVRSPRTDRVMVMPAVLGTYIHRGVQQARQQQYPNLMHEVTVRIPMPNGLVVTGHADEVDPDENSVTDFKTVSDLAYRRRVGSDPAHWRQVMMYAYGLVDMGVLTSDPLVRLVYIDRAAGGVWVVQQGFNWSVFKESVSFLDDVLYALTTRETAERDWPTPMCRKFCPFNSACRPEWSDGELIDDSMLVEAVNVYKKVSEESRTLDKVRAEARERLRGVNGRTADGINVRWTVVNKDDGSYERLDVT